MRNLIKISQTEVFFSQIVQKNVKIAIFHTFFLKRQAIGPVAIPLWFLILHWRLVSLVDFASFRVCGGACESNNGPLQSRTSAGQKKKNHQNLTFKDHIGTETAGLLTLFR